MELRLGSVQSIGENSFNILLSAFACLLVLGLQQLGVPPVPASGLITFVLVVSLSILNIGGACGVYVLIHLLSVKYPRWMLNGYGGKLGATAFIAPLPLILLVSPILGHPNPIVVSIENFTNSPSFQFTSWAFSMSLVTSAAGALIPFFFEGKELFLIPLPVRQKSIYQLTANSRVIATALWGLCVGGPLLLIPQVGEIMSSSWYMGTFVSMTALELSSPIMFRLAASLLAPFLLVILSIPFHGLGGLLGLVALLSVLTVRRLGNLWPRNHRSF